MGIGYPGLYGIHALLFSFLTLSSYSYTLNSPQCPSSGQAQAAKAIAEFQKFHNTTMFYMYLTCLVFSVLVSSLSWYFNKKYLPNDFATLGRIMSALGSILKLSLTLLTLVHWLILFLILFNFYRAMTMT